ncbi:hypothetical protein BJ878DRAFT_546999 [Calycina marina]|uniref:Uncharacterized protein n=1 Tax=Calycina marina TaxID=1763456 RepID=A0A9P7YV76_9HELO|nr:hypothetical protein BJ878DRAFT_546999 [Calycina marina]
MRRVYTAGAHQRGSASYLSSRLTIVSWGPVWAGFVLPAYHSFVSKAKARLHLICFVRASWE